MYKLDSKSEKPLYQQIVDQTKRAVFKGYFDEGEKIPSIRDLSKALLVNSSTVSKAYKELESQGFIETVSGKGTYICLDRDKLEVGRLDAENKIREAIKEGLLYGLGEEKIKNIYKDLLEEEEE